MSLLAVTKIVIVPLKFTSPQGVSCPVVVTVYVPVAVGVPLIVNTLPMVEEVSPAGKLLIVIPVALPPKVYVILLMAVPEHTAGLIVPPAVKVAGVLTTTVAVSVVKQVVQVEQPHSNLYVPGVLKSVIFVVGLVLSIMVTVPGLVPSAVHVPVPVAVIVAVSF